MFRGLRICPCAYVHVLLTHVILVRVACDSYIRARVQSICCDGQAGSGGTGGVFTCGGNSTRTTVSSNSSTTARTTERRRSRSPARVSGHELLIMGPAPNSANPGTISLACS